MQRVSVSGQRSMKMISFSFFLLLFFTVKLKHVVHVVSRYVNTTSFSQCQRFLNVLHMPKRTPSTRPATRRMRMNPGSSMWKSNLFSLTMARTRSAPPLMSWRPPLETLSCHPPPRYGSSSSSSSYLHHTKTFKRSAAVMLFTCATLEGNRGTLKLHHAAREAFSSVHSSLPPVDVCFRSLFFGASYIYSGKEGMSYVTFISQASISWLSAVPVCTQLFWILLRSLFYIVKKKKKKSKTVTV